MKAVPSAGIFGRKECKCYCMKCPQMGGVNAPHCGVTFTGCPVK